MHQFGNLVGSLILFFALLLSSVAFANNLEIISIKTPEEGTPAKEAHIQILFDYIKNGMPQSVSEKDLGEFKILADSKELPILNSKLVPFKNGAEPVSILFVFPKSAVLQKKDDPSKGVLEDSLSNHLDKYKDRNIDNLKAIWFSDAPHALLRGWTRSNDASDLASKIEDSGSSEDQSPDLSRTYKMVLQSFEDVKANKLNYVVFIHDGNGLGLADKDKKTMASFNKELAKFHIQPIVINVPSFIDDDNVASFDNSDMLKQLAGDGFYIKAENYAGALDDALGSAYDIMMSHKVFEADIDARALDVGTYNFTLNYKNEAATYSQLQWPKLAKSKLWLWLLIGGVVVVGIVVAFVIAAKRRNEEEEDYVEEAPQEVCCATCGKVIPSQLNGFHGEYCLSGGRPDCPYYQMPDKGKLTITRGALADITFFIKKDVTTIGSNIDNDIYLADKSVSRKHAAIKTDEGKRYEIRDFGSSNGLYINNEKTSRKFLRDGDKIQFGTVETEFRLK